MRWLRCIGLATCLLAACASTQTPERQRRISDCLSGCKVHEEPPRSGPFDQNAGKPVRKSTVCEDQCESMK